MGSRPGPLLSSHLVTVCLPYLMSVCLLSSQMGDIFDRGDHDLPIQEWVYRLALEAGRANGALYSVMGNHEVRRESEGVAGTPPFYFLPFAWSFDL